MGILIRKPQRGFVLVSSLVMLLSLTLLAATIASRNTLDEMMASNQRDHIDAMGVAESGIEAGFAAVKAHHASSRVFDTIWLQNLMPSVVPHTRISGGTFQVSLPTVTNNLVVLRSVGGVNGASREIEIVMEMVNPGLHPSAEQGGKGDTLHTHGTTDPGAARKLTVTAWRELGN